MVALKGIPNVISYNCSKKIIEQMEKNVCIIRVGEAQATGFLCMIPFPDANNFLPALITVDFILDDNLINKKDQIISLNFNEDIKILNLNERIKYTNREYGTTIIEIKKEDNINNFLELDESIINDIMNNDNRNEHFIDETFYAIQYPQGELSVSYGILDKIFQDKKHKFAHRCSTKGGSSGSPILNMKNKVVGIHVQGEIRKNHNIGIFLNYPIKDFITLKYSDYIKKMNEELLKNFNEKYNLNIEDLNITKLDITRKFAGNQLIKDLSILKFTKLKELYLYDNDISDIKDLEKMNLEKLEIIDLSNNEISDINIFEKIKFNNLKQMHLLKNNISNIKVFEKSELEKLEILDLRKNKIDITKNSDVISYLKSKIKEFYV